MKKTIVYEFTDRDIELLKQPLPDYPCGKCNNQDHCMGCNNEKNHAKFTKELKDNDIFDFALEIKKYKDLCGQQINLRNKSNKLLKTFPIEIQRDVLNVYPKVTMHKAPSVESLESTLELTDEQKETIQKEDEKRKKLLNSPEHKNFVIDSITTELNTLLQEYKIVNYSSDKVKEAEEEFKDILKNDSTFEGFEMISRIDSMFCRCYLVRYKDVPFIISDIGNSNWSFVCNTKEAFYKIATNDFGSEYV